MRGVFHHFVWSAGEDAVTDFIVVFPFRGYRELFIGSDVAEEVRGGFWGAGRDCFCGLLGGEEEDAGPGAVDGGLGEGFGYDCWLVEFDAEAEMDEGVEETWVR